MDRVAILVSAGTNIQLLGVAKSHSGTGANQANEICNLTDDWNLSERITAMGFDTTAANTGIRNGTCALVEKKLGRDLLWLACRHHVSEILMTAASSTLFPSKGPSVSIFVKFRSTWSTINHDFEPSMVDFNILQELGDEKDYIIEFLRGQLALEHHRNDYKELLEVALAFLGFHEITFKAPGAHSNARWMAKAIYYLKIWLFRDQFQLNSDEKEKIPIMCMFILRIYIFSWFTAPSSSSAARNDLFLSKKLIFLKDTYQEHKVNVYKAAASRLANHLWYLSEELVAMAFFDSKISIEEKKKMIHNLKYRTGSDVRKIKLEIASIDAMKSYEISNCVSQNTMNFFEISGISANFLKEDPSIWEDLEEYIDARRKVNSMQVVNDCAERGVKLIQDCCGRTKNEEQLQYLLQVVQHHREIFPQSTRNAIMEGLAVH